MSKKIITTVEDEDPKKDELLDDDVFSKLWSDGGDGSYVELHRVEPKYLNGKKASGFCEQLPFGANLDLVKTRYGGGRFRVIKKALVNGRILDTQFFDIAGDAIIPPAAATPGLPGPMPGEVPLGGDMKTFFTYAAQLMIMRSLLPPPPDAELIKILVGDNRRSEPGLDLKSRFEEIKILMQLAGELVPREGAEPNGGILENVVKMLPLLLAGRSSAVSEVAQLPQRSPATKLVEAAPESAATQPIIPKQTEAEIAKQQTELRRYVAETLVSFFRLKKEPEAVIDHFAPYVGGREQLKQIFRESRDIFVTDVDILLSEIYDDDVELSEKVDEFAAWFDKISEALDVPLLP